TRSPTALNAADDSRASAASDDGAQQAGGARGVRDSEELLAESRRLDELATGLEALGVSLPCQRPVRMMRSGVDSLTGEVGVAHALLLGALRVPPCIGAMCRRLCVRGFVQRVQMMRLSF